MKLVVVSCETKNKGVYSFFLKYGEQLFLDEVKVCQGVVLYVEYGVGIQEILHKNAESVKNMHRLVFEIYRGGDVVFPFYVGDF
ncbi:MULTISPECIES: hypothetical protein [Pseudomonas]|uniref:hypothetical protein n=1 Tax=Pseudomonas TaxID=286 RepID=UPI00106B1CAA|nr:MULTISPECIES: hypothetical protein [Pseudomonas]GED77126.1 hypothetical protein PFL02_39760 [Pseudomonas fluorescens]MBP5111212.1 hypothetical protein [Pseudomonas protegens]MBP5127116.1 hypothetical protein [Pseudomonas protegens]MBP5127133.1 hypothetical protein [Pseudomonas protegens]MDT9645168.1 hypothetical protein [Pseudomonas sp. JV245A]